MILSEKKALDISFKIGLAFGFCGLLFYLLQELIEAFIKEAYPALIVVADFFAIFALITFILWLFLPKFEVLILNLGVLFSLLYGFFYVFAHFFAPEYIGAGFLSFYQKYQTFELNFIGMLLLSLFSIGMIVIFAINFGRRNQFGIFEKFLMILWTIAMGIFSLVNYYYFKNEVAFGVTLVARLGIVFLPVLFEFFLFLFGGLLLILFFFIGMKKKVLQLLTLLLLNTFFLILAIATVNIIGFELPVAITGNVLIFCATITILTCTFFTLKEKYPKSLAKRAGK